MKKEFKDLKEYTIYMTNMAIKIVKPWKIRENAKEGKDYAKGWNDCIKELNKKQEEYLKFCDKEFDVTKRTENN